MIRLLLVCLGGFFGSGLRYLVSLGTSKWFNGEFPVGTLIVNVVGCFLIGFIMELSAHNKNISPELRLFLTTGIMGGFTTFSTFGLDTVNLFANGRYLPGILYATLNLGLGLMAVVLGKFTSRLVWPI